MTQSYINDSLLQTFSKQAFESKKPYPWHDFHHFLTPEAFEELYQSFPPLGLFEKHEGLERGYNQRPHDRFYLAYRQSNYHPSSYRGKGVVQHSELPPAWRSLIEELESPKYQNFMKAALGIPRFITRYAWHVGVSGSEVSPHWDVMTKVGLHNFYFNTSKDWDLAWGGQTLVLGGLKRKLKNPDFSDFEKTTAVPFLDNRSFFFKNTPWGWHGVKPITCPSGKRRLLFSVIFEASPSFAERILQATARIIPKKTYPGQS